MRPTDRGRLFCKVLIFSNQAALRRFWVRGLKNGRLGRCRGVVNALVKTTQKVAADGTVGRMRIVTDPRYFAVMGLVKEDLTMEVLTHESVHAGFAYAKRVKRSPWAKYADLDEEEVAYPSGVIAREIVRKAEGWL